jgi:hypothetical protein
MSLTSFQQLAPTVNLMCELGAFTGIDTVTAQPRALLVHAGDTSTAWVGACLTSTSAVLVYTICVLGISIFVAGGETLGIRTSRRIKVADFLRKCQGR